MSSVGELSERMGCGRVGEIKDGGYRRPRTAHESQPMGFLKWPRFKASENEYLELVASRMVICS
jgi:hypothetical protein